MEVRVVDNTLVLEEQVKKLRDLRTQRDAQQVVLSLSKCRFTIFSCADNKTS